MLFCTGSTFSWLSDTDFVGDIFHRHTIIGCSRISIQRRNGDLSFPQLSSVHLSEHWGGGHGANLRSKLWGRGPMFGRACELSGDRSLWLFIRRRHDLRSQHSRLCGQFGEGLRPRLGMHWGRFVHWRHLRKIAENVHENYNAVNLLLFFCRNANTDFMLLQKEFVFRRKHTRSFVVAIRSAEYRGKLGLEILAWPTIDPSSASMEFVSATGKVSFYLWGNVTNF